MLRVQLYLHMHSLINVFSFVVYHRILSTVPMCHADLVVYPSCVQKLTSANRPDSILLTPTHSVATTSLFSRDSHSLLITRFVVYFSACAYRYSEMHVYL